MIVALKENGKVDGVTKATETRRSKGDQRQFLLLPLSVLSNCLRGLARSQNSGFIFGLKKPYLAWRAELFF